METAWLPISNRQRLDHSLESAVNHSLQIKGPLLHIALLRLHSIDGLDFRDFPDKIFIKCRKPGGF
jgi:hypothetical protein